MRIKDYRKNINFWKLKNNLLNNIQDNKEIKNIIKIFLELN